MVQRRKPILHRLYRKIRTFCQHMLRKHANLWFQHSLLDIHPLRPFEPSPLRSGVQRPESTLHIEAYAEPLSNRCFSSEKARRIPKEFRKTAEKMANTGKSPSLNDKTKKLLEDGSMACATVSRNAWKLLERFKDLELSQIGKEVFMIKII